MAKQKISKGTIARTVVFAFAMLNQALSAQGRPIIPIENAQLETAVTSLLTVASGIAVWWKNNSFTQEAIEADEKMHKKKAEKKTFLT